VLAELVDDDVAAATVADVADDVAAAVVEDCWGDLQPPA